MRVVIVGYGRVGSRTAEVLQTEGHEINVIEIDPEKAERARVNGLQVVEGDGGDERVLEQANLSTADALGALTSDLNVNFTACMIGTEHGCRTVLRIDEDYRQEIYETYARGVDEVIYPERLGAAGAKMAMLGGDFEVISDLTESLTAATFTIKPGSTVIGKRVVEVSLPKTARLYAHGHADEPMTLPLPQTQVEPWDRVAVIAEHSSLEQIRQTLS